MKEKFINNTKSLFKSCIDTKVLFERRKNSLLIPLIIFLLSIFMVCVPSYLFSTSVSQDKVMKNFPGIEKPLEVLLTYPLDCYVKDAKLVCSENSARINETVKFTETNEEGKEIAKHTYTIIANQDAIPSTDVSYDNPTDRDNLIILLKNYVKIRYIERDHVNGQVKTYQIIGDYTNFEGYNFKKISEKIAENPESLNSEISNFVYKSYLSTLDTQLLVDFSGSVVSFLIFVLVSSLILKGGTIFKRKKGFKFSECFKISLTSSLPALLIASFAYLFLKIDFVLLYGTIYIVRIMYIYLKYISSSKNNIYLELYNQTGEERFKI